MTTNRASRRCCCDDDLAPCPGCGRGRHHLCLFPQGLNIPAVHTWSTAATRIIPPDPTREAEKR